MTVTVESIEEMKVRTGKAFQFLHSDLLLIAGSNIDLVICTLMDPIDIRNLSIESNSEILEWQAYGGTQITAGTGTAIKAIPRNQRAYSQPLVDVFLNPTITFLGVPFFDNPIDILAQVAAGNRAYIAEDLISSKQSLLPSACYLIRINNSSTSTVKYDFTLNTEVA